MKSLFITLLIVVLLLSVNLSLATMNHMDGRGHSVCPFESAGVADCNQIKSPLDFIGSHLNAFVLFFSAVPTGNILTFIALYFLALIFLFVHQKFDLFQPRPLLFKNYFIEPTASLLRQQRILYWFSLHENSPAIA